MRFDRRPLPERLRTMIYNAVAIADHALTEEEIFQVVAQETYNSGIIKGDALNYRKRAPSKRLRRLILDQLVAEDKIRTRAPTPRLYFRGRGSGRTSRGWGIEDAKFSNIEQWLPPEEPTRAERLENAFYDTLEVLVERLGRAATRAEWFHVTTGGKVMERHRAVEMLCACERVSRTGLGVRGNPFHYAPIGGRDAAING
jgi:hypothetical protein